MPRVNSAAPRTASRPVFTSQHAHRSPGRGACACALRCEQPRATRFGHLDSRVVVARRCRRTDLSRRN